MVWVVERVGIVVGYPCAVGLLAYPGIDAVYQLVYGYAVKEREVGVAIVCDVGHAHIVLGEVAEQRRGELPCGIRRLARLDGAKLCGDIAGERHGLLASVEARAEYGKVYHESLLVVHDLWLLGNHAHVVGVAVALVVYEHGELGWHHGLYDVLGKRVVAIDVALHEIREVEVGRWLHLQAHGEERAGLVGGAVVECERSAKAVGGHILGCGILGGYEEECGYTLLACGQGPLAVLFASEAFYLLYLYLHLVSGGYGSGLHVGGVDIDHDVAHVRVGAVVDGQRAAECLSGEHQLLLDFELHLGAGVLRGSLLVEQPVLAGAVHQVVEGGKAHVDHLCHDVVSLAYYAGELVFVGMVVAVVVHAFELAPLVADALHITAQREVGHVGALVGHERGEVGAQSLRLVVDGGGGGYRGEVEVPEVAIVLHLLQGEVDVGECAHEFVVEALGGERLAGTGELGIVVEERLIVTPVHHLLSARRLEQGGQHGGLGVVVGRSLCHRRLVGVEGLDQTRQFAGRSERHAYSPLHELIATALGTLDAVP